VSAPEPVTLDGGRIAAWRSGRSGPRVLALHGWLDNANSFLPLAGILDTIELVAIDFPGHGRSAPRPDGVFYNFNQYVFDVLAWLDELAWDDAHLLAHSMGGAVATVVAAAAPDRVRSLSLIEGLGPLSAPAERTAANWQRAVRRARLRPRRVHSSRKAAIAARAEGSDLDPAAAELLAQRALIEVDGGWQWGHDLRLTWPSPGYCTESQVLDLIAAIRAPVLNIHSDPPSGLLEPRLMKLRRAAVRNERSLGCPGGHHLHMHQAERIAAAIRTHIEDHDQ